MTTLGNALLVSIALTTENVLPRGNKDSLRNDVRTLKYVCVHNAVRIGELAGLITGHLLENRPRMHKGSKSPEKHNLHKSYRRFPALNSSACDSTQLYPTGSPLNARHLQPISHL